LAPSGSATLSGQLPINHVAARLRRYLALSGAQCQPAAAGWCYPRLVDESQPRADLDTGILDRLSGIVFSLVDRTGWPQNGFLRLHDIYNFDLLVELVVLSACDTGFGKDIKERRPGRSRPPRFMRGRARVVASLWKVDDEATADLMARFYRGMLQDGKSAASALRDAQVAIWQQRRWKPPYYWAAFVLRAVAVTGRLASSSRASHGSSESGYAPARDSRGRAEIQNVPARIDTA
jgi:hypothetical protein